MKNYLYVILYLIIIGILCLPLLQNTKPIIPETKLNGEFKLTDKPALNKNTFLNGEYQHNYELYFNDHIGFRNFFVKLYNQINFTLFKESTNADIIVGKNNFLFTNVFINSYLGNDYSRNEIKKNLNGLIKIQKLLAKKNKRFLFVCAPGKGYYYPEFIPENKLKGLQTERNYNAFVRLAKNSELNFIDFNQYFMKIKKSSPYPLFPDCGIHWNAYGSLIATDSILKFARHKFSMSLKTFKINKIVLNNELQNPDYDLGNLLNLYYSIPHQSMPYHTIEFSNKELIKPHILIIGDSFYWNISINKVFDNVFSNPSFWYYNSTVYPESYTKQTYVKDINVNYEIERAEIILLLVSDPNLIKVPADFISTLSKSLESNNSIK